MYAAGVPHEFKQPSIDVLDLAAKSETLITDAEVFQELLHRYLAQRRWPAMRQSVTDFFQLMSGRIQPMLDVDVELACGLANQYARLAARDLIHIAIMERVGSTRIVTADAAFDDIQGIERLDPARVEEWRALVETT